MIVLTRIGAGLLMTTCLAGAAAAQTELKLWSHAAGNEEEYTVLTQIIDDFNASQSDWKVVTEKFPQASYNDSVVGRGALGRAARHPRRRRSDHARTGPGPGTWRLWRSTRR